MASDTILEMVERLWNSVCPRPPQSKAALAAAISNVLDLGHKPEAIEAAAMRADYWTVNALVYEIAKAPKDLPRQPRFYVPEPETPWISPEEQAKGLAGARRALADAMSGVKLKRESGAAP